MIPSQASSDDFPRLIGAENFDVRKTRVCAVLDGKHLLVYVQKPDYDSVSEEESDESESDMSDSDDATKAKPSERVEVDSDAVDYDEESEDDKQRSDSDEDSEDNSDTSSKRKKLPVIRPFSRSQWRKDHKRGAKEKPQPLNPRERRRQEAKTKVFLMKTMDNAHVRLVKNLTTSYEIFQFICQKYEGAAFHGDPYFIQHYLMKIRYEEGSDLTQFFLKLENAMKAAQEATDTVMAESQKWKNDLRIWKNQWKYLPYEDLKQSIEGKVRDIQAQERYTLSKRTPETSDTMNERALVTTGQPAHQGQDRNGNGNCSYCDRPRHNIRQCRGLQKDLRYGRVKAGTVLSANFAFKGNSKRDHPYRNFKNWSQHQGRSNNSNNSNNNGNGRRDKHHGSHKHKHDGNGGKNRNTDQGKNRPLDSDSDDDDGTKRKVFHKQRRDTGLIAVATTVNPPISLAAHANVQLDPTWTIDSGCTRHVTQESQWFADIANATALMAKGAKPLMDSMILWL
ncbi:hypothetical protein PHYSODRAFT_325501 [Phytophthora sojae]|uniref:Uncharacterized protein n=1 Tax=Phytophthora sojae (strain P6497) TaxID=1094619 RepID=G4YV80_PHYSP|nr:hypothetical protein PHYSODRAFT_325501 [Phytophthora sojae]EGZ24379.1 hypothetical protein PHYSODRAFT_325501 [Phytophthora sojae]|eukprot:XP_009519667.1 hypothetical protein PHYSODRAFT_325501 [Phytophthora sojae]